MEPKYRKIYVDWWHIRKSTIITAAAITIFVASIGGGLWYASRNNWFISAEDGNYPKDSARIVSFEGEVRITRAATRDTILVTKETYVAAGDTIQTQADGRAILQMIDGSVYSVRPNSTIVVRDTTSIFGGKNVRVRLNDGQLNVRTEDQPADTKNVVEMAETENELLPKTDASFNTDGENAGEIRISRGGVETTMGGEKTTIGENQYAAVDNGKISDRERLMSPPTLMSPGNSSTILDVSGNGVGVVFNWRDSDGGASSYYIQVSRSPLFALDSIMADRDSLSSREFRLSGLPPGTYYWRVRSTARSGQTTGWSDPWKFNVVKKGSATTIDASDWRVESLGGRIYMLSGKTQPGTSVRSQGREIFALADGSFKLQISSPSTETAVELSDGRGARSGYVISLRSGNVLRRY